MVKGTDCPAMTIAVDLGCKATKQTNKKIDFEKKKQQLTNTHAKFPARPRILECLNVFFSLE